MKPSLIPYARQWISAADIQTVTDVLHSEWLTTGPKVEEFEKKVTSYVVAPFGVAVCNGTAALHTAYHAAGIQANDEVIVPAITFVATANAAVFLGAKPIFADVDPDTLLINPASVKQRITKKTKAIIAVDYAGQPCAYDELRHLANTHNLLLLADAAHSLGATYKGRSVGTLADATTFSFHAVKHITTGEGGMVVTADAALADRAKIFRNHGIRTDHRQRTEKGIWHYDMVDIGYNYRITDIQCALGVSQVKRLPKFLEKRRRIATAYSEAFANDSLVAPLVVRPENQHAYHLYVIRLRLDRLRGDRDAIFTALRELGIGVNVHYAPIYLHSFYRKNFQTAPGLCPVAEKVADTILTLPLYPLMTDGDVKRVIQGVRQVTKSFST